MSDEPREWLSAILKLDGMACVNLAEPTSGDLARVAKAYTELKAQLEAVTKERDFAKNQMVNDIEEGTKYARAELSKAIKERDQFKAQYQTKVDMHQKPLTDLRMENSHLRRELYATHFGSVRLVKALKEIGGHYLDERPHCPTYAAEIAMKALAVHEADSGESEASPTMDWDRWREKYYDKVTELNAEEAKSAKLVEAGSKTLFALQCMIIHWNGSVPGLTDQQVWDGAIAARNKYKEALAAYEADAGKGEG